MVVLIRRQKAALEIIKNKSSNIRSVAGEKAGKYGMERVFFGGVQFGEVKALG